ncbi:SDR family NAD(P)-dependent oxidoreductase [Ornithinimicrobium murale]|uniref:SDR family NAD(P)-dependent oxidoreductase n=1 Tax=Ornithinimicrobium murale TaxID=1050153 RepID=UPI000E0D65B5|nr:SDR family oxidoreductase [Ornithinimicrobium murale]
MDEHSSRGVLVTGASRGVGAATARQFAERGDRVVVHYRGAEDRAREVLEALPGTGHTLLRADLTSPEETQTLAAQAAEALGRIDVLVNNAALFLDPEPGGSRRGDHRITDTDYDSWVRAWRTTLETNLMGPANLTFCVARHMREVSPAETHPTGRIVNVGSRGAFRGEPDVPAYGASKAGLHAFGQSMAVALAPHGIGVVSLAPGFIATDMAASVLEGPSGDTVRAQSPFGRVATPEEVAAAICALAEPGAEWVSGAVVDFNGASHLR